MENQIVLLVTYHGKYMLRALVIDKKNVVGICDTPGKAVIMARGSCVEDGSVVIEPYELNRDALRGINAGTRPLFRRLFKRTSVRYEGADRITEGDVEENWLDEDFRARAEEELVSR